MAALPSIRGACGRSSRGQREARDALHGARVLALRGEPNQSTHRSSARRCLQQDIPPSTAWPRTGQRMNAHWVSFFMESLPQQCRCATASTELFLRRTGHGCARLDQPSSARMASLCSALTDGSQPPCGSQMALLAPGRQQCLHWPGRRSPSPATDSCWTRGSWWMGPQAGHMSLTRALATPGCVQPPHDLGRIQRAEHTSRTSARSSSRLALRCALLSKGAHRWP